MSFKNCNSCDKKNNSFFCQPIMSDGRAISDLDSYRPRCSTQYVDKINNKMYPSYEQRMMLIHNATKIMNENALAAYNYSACGPCEEPYELSTQLPEYEMQKCDTRSCTFSGNNSSELGLGRESMYDKDRVNFLAMKEKEQQMFRNTNNVNDSYYPIGGSVKNQVGYKRYSIPGGGNFM